MTLFAISTALTVATGVAGHMGQQQQAKAAARNAQQAYQIDREAAISRQYEEASTTAQKLLDNNRAALRATSTATTSAGESGAYGNSVNRLLQSVGMQEGMIYSREKMGLENVNRSLEFQNRSAEVRRNNTIIQNPPPNALGTALSIGGDIFSSYNRFFPTPPKS
jgi:hypothetical protein